MIAPTFSVVAEPVGEERAGFIFSRWGSERTIVLAVSGGPDSMAMLGLAAAWSRRAHKSRPAPELLVATVDHRLRPDSEAEAEMVGDAARLFGLPHRILRWQGAKPETAIQERARDARYGLLAALAREAGARMVFTAHNLEDQAETVLMRLCHGSGIGGLSAMRPESHRGDWTLGRPLLFTPGAALRATCEAHGWPFVDDPSNNDPQFTRVRLRRLMPLLAAEGLTAERLAHFSLHAAECDEALEIKAIMALRSAIENRDLRCRPVDATELAREPHEIIFRAMALLIDHARHVFGLPPTEYRRHRLKNLIDELFCKGKLLGVSERSTFAGLKFKVLSDADLHIEPAPPRRRGLRKS